MGKVRRLTVGEHGKSMRRTYKPKWMDQFSCDYQRGLLEPEKGVSVQITLVGVNNVEYLYFCSLYCMVKHFTEENRTRKFRW